MVTLLASQITKKRLEKSGKNSTGGLVRAARPAGLPVGLGIFCTNALERSGDVHIALDVVSIISEEAEGRMELLERGGIG